jgi:hypothetical protein
LLFERHPPAIERVTARKHDEENGAEAPQVGLLPIRSSPALHPKHLRGPVLRRAHEGLRKRGAIADHLGETKVSDFHCERSLAGADDQNILGLQIAMYYVPRVHIAHTLEKLLEDLPRLFLAKAALAYDV